MFDLQKQMQTQETDFEQVLTDSIETRGKEAVVK
jgi:hypothetical protein